MTTRIESVAGNASFAGLGNTDINPRPRVPQATTDVTEVVLDGTEITSTLASTAVLPQFAGKSLFVDAPGGAPLFLNLASSLDEFSTLIWDSPVRLGDSYELIAVNRSGTATISLQIPNPGGAAPTTSLGTSSINLITAVVGGVNPTNLSLTTTSLGALASVIHKLARVVVPDLRVLAYNIWATTGGAVPSINFISAAPITTSGTGVPISGSGGPGYPFPAMHSIFNYEKGDGGNIAVPYTQGALWPITLTAECFVSTTAPTFTWSTPYLDTATSENTPGAPTVTVTVIDGVTGGAPPVMAANEVWRATITSNYIVGALAATIALTQVTF